MPAFFLVVLHTDSFSGYRYRHFDGTSVIPRFDVAAGDGRVAPALVHPDITDIVLDFGGGGRAGHGNC